MIRCLVRDGNDHLRDRQIVDFDLQEWECERNWVESSTGSTHLYRLHRKVRVSSRSLAQHAITQLLTLQGAHTDAVVES